MRVLLAFTLAVGVACSSTGARADPGELARAAYADALRGGVDFELVDRDGNRVAAARGNVVEVGGVTGTVDGDRFTIDGVTIDLPGARGDPRESLAPLLRAARFERDAIIFEGEPRAKAWITEEGTLERLEVDVGDGFRMVVFRAGRYG